jgi:ABC-2 type transport system permease protein
MMFTRFISFFHAIWIIFRKDIRVLLRQPANIAAILVPPIAFLLVNALGAVAVGRNPVALVTLDHGVKGQQMAQIIHNADVFRITDATPVQARVLLNNIDVAAIITIPADFTQLVGAHKNAPIDVTVNNLNLDFTNDIRRSVPDAITQFYQAQGKATPVKVTMQETDLRHRDVEFFQYNILPTILLLLMISGLINGGLSTAREWESRTVKELLLSPVSRGAIIAGKVFAGFAITFLLGMLVLLLGYVVGWTQPEGVYWLSTLLTIALVSLLSAGLGVAIGAALRRVQVVIAVSINVAIYLFFLAGGIGVLAFEPAWLQNIAAFEPLTYGRHALEQAVFYSASDQFGLDMAVLSISALVAIGLGVISMRRGITS